MFPENGQPGNREGREESLSVKMLGNRIYQDQTLVEYLIEFLLVFSSAKESDGTGTLRFHNEQEVQIGKLPYYVNPRIALRRFIFYEHSKQDSRSKMDTVADIRLREILNETTQNGTDDVLLIHDLLQSYAIITRNRGWYAQALLPAAPELLLTDLQGIRKRQELNSKYAKNYGDSIDDDREIDTKFDLSKHNFLARGGQVLYLHLLQPMADHKEIDQKYRKRLEFYLRNMLESSGKGLGLLANFIQNEWEYNRAGIEYKLELFNMGHIRDEYRIRGERFLDEVTRFLSNDIHPITRIELLAHGMVMSLLRIMQLVAHQWVYPNTPEPLWVMDMSHLGGTSNIGRIAAESYSAAYETFQAALNKICEQNNIEPEKRFDMIQKAKRNSSDVFKKLAKEMKLVIPVRGAYERFSLSESLMRYLVLAIVKPHTKMTLDSFFEKLYEHFRMVIAPEQYRQAIKEKSWVGTDNMADYFDINAREFQNFLKQCGFLRELSDATAIVENPYEEVEFDETAD